MFKTHHYLSGNLANACRCYAAFWCGKPIAFCALIPQQGFERWYRVSRIVTLPDYQGIGIGSRFLDSLAELYVEQGYRFSITASHPSVLSHCKRSQHWKAINVQKTGSKRSNGRAVVSFLYR
jgi:GNAT superfamily N-acetyltransferase